MRVPARLLVADEFAGKGLLIAERLSNGLSSERLKREDHAFAHGHPFGLYLVALEPSGDGMDHGFASRRARSQYSRR